MGGGWSGSDDEESRASLQRAVALGCNFFDTAFAYGEGHSESLLGELIKANPGKKLYTATKIPPKNRQWPARPEYTLDESYPPEYIEEYVHKSLQAADLPAFDLVQFHTWDDHWMQDDRWAKKLDELRRQGLFAAVGISLNRWQPWNGLEAVRSGLVDSVQVVYNLFDQNPEDELFPACREHDVAVIARVPFDEGSLTGKLHSNSTWPEDDFRNRYFSPEKLGPTLERVEAAKADVRAGSSLPELALRFILANETVSTVIPGMRKIEHVTSNMAVSDKEALPAEELQRLRKHRWVRTP